MFAIGDKVVYPMHGAGIIETIEEKKILEESREYYVLKLSFSDLRIMVPVSGALGIGVRSIVPQDVMDVAVNVLSGLKTEMPANWNHRYRYNLDKLRTGDICQVAEVVRNLTQVDRVKKLSTGEKKMLSDARQILLSEMILVQKITKKEAEQLLEETIA